MSILKKTTKVLSLCLPFILLSCDLSPEYQTPEYKEAATWPTLPDYNSNIDTQITTKLSWDKFYSNKIFQKIIAIAIDNNKDLKIATYNIEEAKFLYNISKADLYPNINLESSVNIRNNSDKSISVPGQQNKIEQYTAGVQLSNFELDIFGRIKNQNSSALNTFFAQEQNYRVVINILIANIANAYIQLLTDYELLEITEKTLANQEVIYQILKKSLDRGIISRQDVDRAATSVSSAKVNIQKFKRNILKDKNTLYLLLGVPYHDFEIPKIALASVKFNEQVFPGLPSEVLLTRPDVRQAEFELIANNANIGVARASFFPRISLIGSYGYASLDLKELFTNSAFGAWTFIPQITTPIFQAGRNIMNLKLSEIRKEAGIAKYERTIQNAFREISDELATKYTINEQLKNQEDLVRFSKKIYDISHIRYKAGTDNFLSVLDAQREYYNNQQSAILTKQESLVNQINLYKSLGGGFQTS